MRITTKRGDDGRTSLYFGGRVKKDDIRVDICGTLDEISSFLGVSKSLIKDKEIKQLIKSIQKDLLMVGSEIATRISFLERLKRRITADHTKRLEEIIKELERTTPKEKRCFHLAGGDPASSMLDVARTLTRRAERRIVTLKNKGGLKNQDILIYMNRLSDLLYLLEKSLAKRGNRPKRK